MTSSVPMYKSKGKLKEYSDNREVNLLHISGKVYGRVIPERGISWGYGLRRLGEGWGKRLKFDQLFRDYQLNAVVC